jgi:diamine N-acetyltransferase
MESSDDSLRLLEGTADNWQEVADLAPRDDQRDFVPALAARYLLLDVYGDTWHCLGAFEGDTAVAHVMWAIDEDSSRWIGGLVVDQQHQGRGIGRQVLVALIERLRQDPGCGPIRMSHHPTDLTSRTLFASLGFVPTGDEVDGELVMELAANR